MICTKWDIRYCVGNALMCMAILLSDIYTVVMLIYLYFPATVPMYPKRIMDIYACFSDSSEILIFLAVVIWTWRGHMKTLFKNKKKLIKDLQAKWIFYLHFWLYTDKLFGVSLCEIDFTLESKKKKNLYFDFANNRAGNVQPFCVETSKFGRLDYSFIKYTTCKYI